MLKNNYHTHCYYCHHAKGEVKDYVSKAIELGFEELGMSDHAPVIERLCELYGQEYACFASNMDHKTIDIYLNDIENAQKQYQGKIKIYKGFETEFLSKGLPFYQKLRAKTDYLILGMHYFEHEGKIISTYDDFQMNYKTISSYADACIKGMESGLYNVLAHPDLFMFTYKNVNNQRMFDDEARKASIRIIESAIKNNVYLELNCGGLRDYGAYQPYTQWNYPWYEFWEIVKKYPNAKIIIGADAHAPEALNCDNTRAIESFAKQFKIKVEDKMSFFH